LKEELFMPKAIVVLSCMLMLAPVAAIAQTDQSKPAPQEQLPDVEKTLAIKRANEQNPRFVRTLTNVQIELTLTDQAGSATPDKKIVSMVVSSGSWGKIRSAGSFFPVGTPPVGVDLNVDARPFVSVDGPIQLELTLNYSPPGSAAAVGSKDSATARTGINQSLTVVLQNGKPLIVSQSADPVSDRKVIVEVKATVLK
jgi:hypothetical protein